MGWRRLTSGARGRDRARNEDWHMMGTRIASCYQRGMERYGRLPQLTPGFFVTKVIQASSCSHFGGTLLPRSFDQDSFDLIGSNTSLSGSSFEGHVSHSSISSRIGLLFDSLLVRALLSSRDVAGMRLGDGSPATSSVSLLRPSAGVGVLGLKKPIKLLWDFPGPDLEFSLDNVALFFF